MTNATLAPAEAERARLAMIAAQSAYALNNGGGIVPNQPFVYIDDQTTAGRPGYTPLNFSTPPGFVVRGIYQDRGPASTNTGADMFVAFNQSTRQVLIGIAGTNGVGHDMPDTLSDIAHSGANQARWLAINIDFRGLVADLGDEVGGVGNLQFIVGGDSLSGVPAILVPTMLTSNIKDGLGNPLPPIENLRASQFSITNVVPLGANYAASILGIESQLQAFAQSAEIFNFTVRNDITGYDLVTGMGGGSPGRYFSLEAPGEVYSSPVSRHQFNYGFASGLQAVGNDLTQATPIDQPPVLSYQSIASVSAQIAGVGLVENNWLSISAAGYAGLLLSAPGESAASAAQFLTSEWGWPSALANTAGAAIEVISRGASYANPAFAVGALLAGFMGGKAMGSDAPVLPGFPPVQPGYTRTIFQDPTSPFVGAVDRGPDQTILRYSDGSTRSYDGDGIVTLQRPDGTMMTRNAEGDGALRIGATGATTLIHAADVVDALPFSVTRIISSNADGLVVIKDYDRTGLTIHTGSFVNNEFVSQSTISTPFLDGAASVVADGNFRDLNSIAAGAGVSVQDLLAANPSLSVNMSLAPGTVVSLPTASAFTSTVRTSSPAAGEQLSDATSGGPSTIGNNLASAPTYNIAANSNWLGDVNLAQGNQALGNYFLTDGLRPGNSNLGFNIDESTGIGLNFPVGTNPYGYSLFGSSLNNYATANYSLFPADPLVLDLDGDGVKLTSYSSAPVLFDADNDGGSLEQTGWVSAQDGIVVHDLNNDGKINSIAETLSEYYNGVAGSDGIAGTKPYANGFTALKSLDSNEDNVFNSADAAWSNLRVWVDANHDGKTDAGELRTFDSLGITDINLTTTAQSGEVRDGNEVLARGSFVQGGVTREAVAANFLANPAGSTIAQAGSGITVSTESAAGAIQSFVSQNTVATVNETLSTAALSVRHVTGGAGNDTLSGDAQANWLAGSTGADSLSGAAGDDVLLIDAADIVIDGGDGLDVAQVVGSAGVALNMAQSHIEIAVGGGGADTFVGGGRSTVFVRGGAGDDLIIGGAANDALSGEDGDDLIDGGGGNDLIRGHRGKDQLLGGAGDDVIDGGLEDDTLHGGSGNDVLTGGRGDDSLHGSDGIDVAQYAGSYADYRITKISDANGGISYRVVDTRTGRDGADTLTGIEKLSFSDISRVDLTLGSPLPVKDILTVNSSGQTLGRTVAHLISKNQLLANDRDWDSDTSQLSITEVLEAKGGTVSLTQNGDILFTPDASYSGVMSFKYKIKDNTNQVTEITNSATGQTEVMKGAVYLQTPDLQDAQGRVDPLALEQWYLSDINVMPVWQDYTGKGVRIGQFEPGGAYSTGPEVFDYRHPDLQPNADKAWLNTLDSTGNNNTPQTFSDHATMVAGVMVAARNGEGGIGVAYDASLAGYYIQGEGLEVSQLSIEISNALAKFKNFDVVNNSWGPAESFGLNVVPAGALETSIVDAVSQGRNGLGTAIVMAGGNDRATGANTNYNALTANRAVIVAGSINAPGDLGSLQLGAKPFSNPGASILVSAPGSNIDSTSRELMADNGSTFGNDYNTSQGTSFAAPIVSGVIALMLEANPGLGYRDIQTILAMSATRVDDPNGADWTTNTARIWNGGGMHVSHDYGFGKVDARAAVRLAETWTEQNTFANEYTTTASSGAINAAIPDGSGMLTRTLSMGAGLEVESAQVTLELDHQRWGDLIVKLISPTGTESVLVNRPGKAPGSAATDLGDASSGILSFSFNSTRLRGEQSAGTWTLQVIDAATGNVGTLKNWKLDLYGKAVDSNDVYVYTNEFATFAGAARSTLTDSNGGRDTLNASAVTGNSVINLNNGSTSTLAGKSLALSGEIEIAFGGDGDDTLTGNALSNVLLGERGADTIQGGDGNDTLDGGKGSDLLTGGAGSDLFVISKDAGAQDTIVDLGVGTSGSVVETIALIGFGDLSFAKLSPTQVGADVRLDLGNGQAVLLRNQQAAQLSAAQFQFFDSQAALQAWQLAGQGGGIGGPTEGDDVLQGTTGDDVLAGLGGNDTLSGNDGNDKLLGGSGQDALNGGAGNDVLVLDGDQGAVSYSTGLVGPGARTGGTGADRFLVAPDGGGSTSIGLSGANMTASNLIYDFDLAVDKIDLSQFAWITSFSQLTATKALTINSTFITRVSAQATGQSTVAVGLYGIEPAALTAANFIFAGNADATSMPVSNASASTVAGAAPLALVSATAATTTQPPVITGTSADDTLVGDAGANTLDGLVGADGMTGRTGDDTYVVDDSGDSINELPGGGYDSVQSTVTYTLSADVEALTLGGSADLNATGNDQRNRLVGNAGANRLDGGAEADDMLGRAGNDAYVVDNQLDTVFEEVNEGVDAVESAVSWTLGKNIENLALTGSQNINATGNELANVLTGNTGDNILDGAQGADSMAGGAGNDTYYVDGVGDAIVEALNGGLDTIYSSVNLNLGVNVENAVLFGAATSATGNALDNTLVGNGLANTLSGDAGDDYLDGQGGNDALYGGGGDDYLDGGRGRNVLAGGLGNDTYVVGSTGSTGFQYGRWATQQGGYDSNQRWFTADVNGDGKADLVNIFNENGTMNADAHISTGTGYQIQRWATHQGGYWDAQRWSVADVNGDGKADLVNMFNDGGAMTADAHISTGSGFQIQRWATRQGGYSDAQRWSIADVNGDGKADLVNIFGENGAMNADAHISTGSGFQFQRWATQQGGYWDSQRWSVADVNGDGKADLVNMFNDSGAMTADAHISTGSGFQIQRWATRQGGYSDAQRWSIADVNGDGKADLVNIFGENGAMNADAHISTGSGFQFQRWATQQGGYWDAQRWNVADVNGDGKADLVNVFGENGAMNADAHISTGSGFQIQRWATQQGGYWDAQRWSLSDANGDGKSDLVNLMNDGGSMSVDVHTSGNAADPRNDVITEQAGEGIDTVRSSSSYTLAPTLENLVLTGSEVAQGSGNASGNSLTGNSAMNTLKGYAGDDVLDGGGGNDFLLGGIGNDTYMLGRGHGIDRISENDATSGNTDVALFNSGIAADQLWFRQAGNDLEVSVIGTGDKFLIDNWYLSSTYHVEQFKTSDGHVLLDSQVQNLVQAMAGFSPPAAGQTTLPSSYQSSLNSVIAANWH